MNFLKLKVVIWKNVIIRKRHWFLTAIESLLPVAIFFIIAYARSHIKGLQKINFDYPTYNEADPISYFQVAGDVKVLFTPDNSYYQNIMQKTVVKFQLQSDRVKAFDSVQNLKQYYYNHTNDTIIAIIFKGNNKQHLDYIIRYYDQYGGKSDFLNTNHLVSNTVFQFQNQKNIDYLWKGFLAMQKAIDISFIEVNSGKDIEDQFNFYLKEFPYPPHKVDEGITSIFIEYLPLLTLFSFIFVCPAILKRVVEEKQTGTKELLKMNGMDSWMLWLGWLIYGMIPMMLSVSLIVILMKIPIFGTEYPPIEYSDGTVLFCYLLLYCMAANIFCFAISSCFNNPSMAMVSGILIWILSYFVPKYSLGADDAYKYSWGINIILNLLPNMALHYGYSIMASYEEREIGVQWSNIGISSSGSSEDITLLNVFIMLLLDMVIYMLFTIYMDKVNPGAYGVKDSPLFIWRKIKKLFTRKTSNCVESEVQPLELKNVEDIENMKQEIVLENVSKKFGKKTVVDNLNLKIYKNHITVLLGHNGAGKSTTMSMITGMLEPTSGSILINNMDIKTNQDDIRSKMGLCPQHNHLFTDLTVKEHLVFFAKLKGKSTEEASKDADMLLKELQIDGKRNEMAHTLSGGMKRKLCLAMAVTGDSSILVLDEPSSGMDPESRRALWDLLLKWRMKKTILITTHFMEEADVLGDWIAIMSNGRLNCYGTPMYLKKKFETGYHLSLMVANSAKDKVEDIKTFVKDHMSGSNFKSQNGQNLIFILPFESSQITNFLSGLEQQKGKLGIENLSLTLTTLEDVFLKTDCVVGDEKDESEEYLNKEIPTVFKEEGTKRRNLQIKTLFNKRVLFFWKRKFNYIFLFLIAYVFFGLTTYFSTSSRNKYVNNGPELKLNLDIYKKSSVFVNSSSDVETTKYKNIYKQLIDATYSSVFDVGNVENEILKTAHDNIIFYKEHIIISSEFSNSLKGMDIYALYNSFVLHSSPISLNVITNTIAKALLGDTFSISVSNWPLETPNTEFKVGFSTSKIAILWLVMIPLGCLFTLGSFIIFPHSEITSNFLQIQYMCGVKHYLYWIVNLLIDLLVYLLLMAILAITVCCISPPFRGVHEFGVFYLILFLYGISGIPCTYLFCRKKSAAGAFSLLVIMGMFLGIIMTLVVGLLSETGDEHYELWSRRLKILCFLFIPQVGLSHLLVEFSKKAVENYNMEALPKQMMSMCTYENNPCCSSLTSSECSQFRGYMDNLDLWYLMLVSAVIFFTINSFLDSYYLRNRLSKLLFKTKLLFNNNEQLTKIINDRSYSSMTSSLQETLMADKMLKCYSGKPVVRNVSIKLNKQECLGILGVNGAGKTTTFRMLTRDAFMNMGKIDLTVNKKKVDIGNDEYLESLGYCPQNDSLNSYLTGREILEVVANLRGINDPKVVNSFLNFFELTKYADIPCGHYSGGNKRKLSLAISLIGFPQFVLLDEPTNGVDPSTRRKFWSLIKNIQKSQNLSFILTSHSMVECEALCNSLKIMKDGEFKKEGSIHELKKEYGGFSVKVKLKNRSYDDVDCDVEVGGTSASTNAHLDSIKEKIKNHFQHRVDTCDIKDEHSGLLQYYIKGEELKWSNIFKEFEVLKAENIIEDYSISEASLEDVFLSVARSND